MVQPVAYDVIPYGAGIDFSCSYLHNSAISVISSTFLTQGLLQKDVFFSKDKIRMATTKTIIKFHHTFLSVEEEYPRIYVSCHPKGKIPCRKMRE